MERHDSTSQLTLIRSCLTFIWRICDLAEERNPLHELKFEKELKAEFLNKYTALIYHLKIKRNNLIILNELLTFIRKFIFFVESNQLIMKKIDSEKAENSNSVSTWDDLLKSLRLDNLMELHDYM
jgi:hypothetical protein